MPGITRVRQNLRTAMADKQMSIRVLAKKIGMSYPFLSEVLNGHRSIGVEHLERLADGLDIDIRELFDPPKKVPA